MQSSLNSTDELGQSAVGILATCNDYPRRLNNSKSLRQSKSMTCRSDLELFSSSRKYKMPKSINCEGTIV